MSISRRATVALSAAAFATALGTGAIYSPTATGFRLFVRWSDGTALTPATAQSYQWHVNWIGVDNP
jgi:hypothetical protein